MHAKVITTEEEQAAAYAVRKKVFVEEQHVPEHMEIDELENQAIHFILVDDKQAVGAGRLRLIDGIAKVERICVLASHRKKAGGKIIMAKIEDYARENHVKKAKLNAQTHAEEFYKKLGYETISGTFMDAGIPHVTMIKEL